MRLLAPKRFPTNPSEKAQIKILLLTRLDAVSGNRYATPSENLMKTSQEHHLIGKPREVEGKVDP